MLKEGWSLSTIWVALGLLAAAGTSCSHISSNLSPDSADREPAGVNFAKSCAHLNSDELKTFQVLARSDQALAKSASFLSDLLHMAKADEGFDASRMDMKWVMSANQI